MTDARTDPTAPGITMYWRPGCGFCSSLRAGLQRAGVPVREVDIWSDDAARAFVRSVANGNETVPTLTIGTVSVVNPSVREVVELARTELPDLVIEAPERTGLLRSLFPRRPVEELGEAGRAESGAHSGPDRAKEAPMVRARWNGEVIAESDDTVVVEGNHYFPIESVRAEFLRPSAKTTVCSWKGTASYHSLSVAGKENNDAAWFYPEPKAAAENITGRLAFWRGVEVEVGD